MILKVLLTHSECLMKGIRVGSYLIAVLYL